MYRIWQLLQTEVWKVRYVHFPPNTRVAQPIIVYRYVMLYDSHALQACAVGYILPDCLVGGCPVPGMYMLDKCDSFEGFYCPSNFWHHCCWVCFTSQIDWSSSLLGTGVSCRLWQCCCRVAVLSTVVILYVVTVIQISQCWMVVITIFYCTQRTPYRRWFCFLFSD